MSEPEMQQSPTQDTAEIPNVQLSETELEQVAGGGWLEDIAQAVIDYMKPDIPS
jgi:hypothetical protein